MIRVAILDDHPAVLAGLSRLVGRADGLVPVAAVDTAEALWPEVDKTRPHVVVLDYDLARGDGLSVCQRLKERAHPPAVAIYSAYAGPALGVAARLAGADAVVDKRAPAADLIAAIRQIAAGGSVMPDIPMDLRAGAMQRLEPDDVPIAAMILAGTSHQGVAQALGTDRRDVVRRLPRIIGRLRPRSRVCIPDSMVGALPSGDPSPGERRALAARRSPSRSDRKDQTWPSSSTETTRTS